MNRKNHKGKERGRERNRASSEAHGNEIKNEKRLTMLPAWSRKAIPLVFISLYGLLSVLTLKPLVWGQGSNISLIITLPRRSSASS